MKSVIVIGAGLGGLSAAISLAAKGYGVTVLEQQAEAGGKLQRIEMNGYRFDRGPSTITMPHIFRRLFSSVGRQLEDYVQMEQLEPGTRNLFTDGHAVDFTSDLTAMEKQIARFSPKDAAMYRSFMKESKRLYDTSESLFLNRLLHHWRAKADIRLLAGLISVRPATGYHSLLRRYFSHPNTLAMLGRYATYVGSSPYLAPAIFAMLPHLEQQLGVYGVRDGTYKLVAAFRKLAEELGVVFRFGCKVTAINSSKRRVTGVSSDCGDFSAELVIANGDVLSTAAELLTEQQRPSLSDRRIDRLEPSLSGYAVLAGVRRVYDRLLHHTVFFPERYGSEFEDIFRRKRLPAAPAIYVCYSGYSQPGMAPEGCSNLFLLANAPYMTGENRHMLSGEGYGDRLLRQLERAGLQDLTASLACKQSYTPVRLQDDTSAYRGGIYGISSNSARQTFFRPSNRGDLNGLWFVGGTTHPGGGTPLVTLSGMLVAEAIDS
ncbi:phytoene desaturase family protein [Paenibacillus sp. J5C_2022]|uniref:phytoene desaturase family protein n=1 Tax=Paenibacillus sp. J5C2022 TaxID=2977129 RepID=UPI0021D156D7|nr:phytoene desaturase family protein [Paenibacillus sp. J5C2022]MCU6709998.1 phytoene desaturase family protein [Paenibacillus sp. J5C2022]